VVNLLVDLLKIFKANLNNIWSDLYILFLEIIVVMFLMHAHVVTSEVEHVVRNLKVEIFTILLDSFLLIFEVLHFHVMLGHSSIKVISKHIDLV